MPTGISICGQWRWEVGRRLAATTRCLSSRAHWISCILQMLEEAPDHGYGVSRRIGERTEGDLTPDDGALYQSLHRMRARGWIVGE